MLQKFFIDQINDNRCDQSQFLKSSNISETGEVTPTKIGVDVCYINAYLHEFFEPILSD